MTKFENAKKQVEKRSIDKLNLTLDKIVDINNFVDSEGNNLLHWAVINGNYLACKQLIKMGIDINAKNTESVSPLEFAIQFNEKRIIKFLLNNNAELFNRNGFTILHASAAQGNIDLLKIFINKYSSIDMKDNSGNTPLLWASQEGKIRCIEFLLLIDADVNSIDNHGFSPIYYAICQGNYYLFYLLISYGANTSTICDSESLLHVATAWNRAPIVYYLVKRGIDINLKNKEGLKAIDYAKMYNYKNLEYFLQNKGIVSV
ncbi:MAG: ankyrin repeat domain-containing protein [Prevotellaceae bacterium]|nr:ankyrin repeat domain-containing protein [Prevotellaceae bacterium]